MATDLEKALGNECKRLADRVRLLETEGRDEFHRIRLSAFLRQEGRIE